MAHLITPITVPLPTGYAQHFTRPAGSADAGTPATTTDDIVSCCGFYGSAAPKLGKPLYSETNQDPGSCVSSMWHPVEILFGPGLVGWQLYGTDNNSCPTEDPPKGAVSIGVCCSASITIRVIGLLSRWWGSVDALNIKLNGALIYSHASDIAEGVSIAGALPPPPPPPDDPEYWSHLVYTYTEDIVIPLPANPCGDILLFEADSVSSRKHTNWPAVPDRLSSWQVHVLSIT